MSHQPMWTEGRVFAYFESEDFKGLAKAINAERKSLEEQRDEAIRLLAAERKQRKPLVDALEWAWTIIANAGGGNWQRESKEWQDAAAKWRDKAFHPALAKVKEGE